MNNNFLVNPPGERLLQSIDLRSRIWRKLVHHKSQSKDRSYGYQTIRGTQAYCWI